MNEETTDETLTPNPALDHHEYEFLAVGVTNAFDQLLRYALACHDLGDDSVLVDLAGRQNAIAQRMNVELATIAAKRPDVAKA